MVIAENANVEMNMGDGNSSAILNARNLTIKSDATLSIKTKQDNNGSIAMTGNNGWHVAPISLGTFKPANADTSLNIEKNATLKIVRAGVSRYTITPLISLGDERSSNAGAVESINVDDNATLDLQDAAQSNWHEYGDKLANYLGNKDRLYTAGLISIYGIDATTDIHFGNARYVNLQRTGNQHGILLRLEGGSSISGNSAVVDAKGMPLKQWIAGNYSKNADYSWNLDYLRTENKWGDYSYNYNGKNQSNWSQYTSQRNNGMTFDQSNGAVKFSDNRSLVYSHSDFNKMFNWWTPQRLSFGTIFAVPKASVEDVNALVTHVNANTKVSPSLNANNINFTWKDTDGNVVKAPKNIEVNWVVDPNTVAITADNSFDRTGEVEITIDGQTQKVVVPVKVLGAIVRNNGAKVNQNDESTLPAASHFANTSAVDRFGVSSVDWVDKPAIQSFGKVTVHYADGTSQVLDPYVDVREVEHGQDHKNDEDIYLTFEQTDTVELPGGITKDEVITTNLMRDRITDYKYPVDDSRRVTYTEWITQTVTKYL